MYDYLIDHAYRNIWCNPAKDRQYILALHRITQRFGVIGQARVMLRNLPMPTPADRYHVFQVGHIHPTVLGMIADDPNWKLDRWLSISDAMIQESMLVNIYNDAGVQVPRFDVFYRFTDDKTLIIAVRERSQVLVNYKQDTLYMRFYSNAWFETAAGNVEPIAVHTEGSIPADTDALLALQINFNTWNAKPGLVQAYRNGILISAVNLITCQVGDVVEFVYDSSVRTIHSFAINQLPTFTSELDGQLKYLIHPPKETPSVIRYLDDIDLFLEYTDINGNTQAVYYHRNLEQAHRMVTYRDYSLSTGLVATGIQYLRTLLNDPLISTSTVKVKLITRNAGIDRPLVLDNNRIYELYKLTDVQIVQAMVGVNATVNEWRAAVLENSPYVRLMSSDGSNVTKTDVENTYGYNAIAKLLADTPSRVIVEGEFLRVEVPYGLTAQATAYEYDIDGKLLSWHNHTNAEHYYANNINTASVEFLMGVGNHQPDVKYGINDIPVPALSSYRVYKQFPADGTPWQDITGSNQYYISDSTLRYTNTDTGYVLMVRSDVRFVAYDVVLPANENVFTFALTEFSTIDGNYGERIMPLPMGSLDLFLNGHLLVKGLGYVCDFPYIVIDDKRYLEAVDDNQQQQIHVRMTGFCTPEIEWEDRQTAGFIDHGMLLDNNKFDVVDDLILHISVDGKLKHRDQILISDENTGISVDNPINGQPYQICPITVPLRSYITRDTYTFRNESMEIDNRVANYLTVKHPEPDRSAPSAIVEKYTVYSPFISRIIHALRLGEITEGELSVPLTDNHVALICEPNEYLLKTDPIRRTDELDLRYVAIHPHYFLNVVTLNLLQYRFLLRVVALYAPNLFDLSPFVVLE